MNRERKAAVVEEVATQIQESQAVFAVDYRGISVPQAAELRAKLTEAGARFRVVKNTLTERAADKAGAEPLKEVLEGPTAFTFVGADGGDVALAAKALAEFNKQFELLTFKGGLMNGEPLTAEQINALSRLPARDVLHGQLVGVIASPITGLVRGLNSLIAGLAIQLKQIAEGEMVPVGGAPATEAPAAEEGSAKEEAAPAAEEPAAEDASADDGAAEDAPAAEEPAVEEASDGEGTADDSAAEEAPAAEEASADEASADDAAAEEAPEGDASGDETDATDTPSEGEE